MSGQRTYSVDVIAVASHTLCTGQVPHEANKAFTSHGFSTLNFLLDLGFENPRQWNSRLQRLEATA